MASLAFRMSTVIVLRQIRNINNRVILAGESRITIRSMWTFPLTSRQLTTNNQVAPPQRGTDASP
jgi:hypothetical protein